MHGDMQLLILTQERLKIRQQPRVRTEPVYEEEEDKELKTHIYYSILYFTIGTIR